MPFDDRDQKFERALAQHLRGGSAQANCPDAETLAAYHERNLSLEEMARWKEHIYACDACQEAMALAETAERQLAVDWEERGVPVVKLAGMASDIAGSGPNRSVQAAAAAPRAAGTPVAIMRRRPALLRWAIPLGAVAAGVLVFIGIYEQRSPKVAHYSDTIVARRDAPATPVPTLDDQKSKIQLEPETKDQRLATAEVSRQKTEQVSPAAPAAKSMAGAKESDEEGQASRDQFAGGRLEKKKLSSPAPAPAPKIPVQADSVTVVAENAPVIAAAPPPAPPPAPMAYGAGVGGAAAKAPAHADTKTSPPSAAQTVTVESQALPLNGRTDSLMMKKQGVSNELVELTAAEPGVILTPDNKVFWKLQPAGTLHLTTDGGKKWKSLDTGANANLTTGFAPSSRVCWIAGKAGTLVLTTDRGGHWTTIATPITGDLGGVHAADAKYASIWDAAKHVSYETSDGGASWKQTAND